MKVFSSAEIAIKSMESKEDISLNSMCPFQNGEPVLCGNWCALFHASRDKDDRHTVSYVILGCKGTDKQLYIEEHVKLP